MHETLLMVFIAITSIAVVIQMGVLIALYTGMKKTSARLESLANQVESRAIPTLDMAQDLLRESKPKVETILANLADTSTTIRQEVERLDVSVADMVDRARLQVIRMDELVSATLDRVEDATEIVHRSVIGPVRQAQGVIQGLTTALATFFNRGPYARTRRGDGHKEEMFI